MDRKFKTKAWVTAGMMLLASVPALAAGLGRLTVTSTLGQPLRGEIELLSVDKKDLGSIRANFASLEAFKEAKLERSPALSAIRFSVEQKKNGDPYLKITSTKPIDDPFLDMLIEIDWPSGRLVREYTVLLDPPGYGGEAPLAVAPVAPPVAKPAPAQAVAAKPAEMPAEAAKPEIRARIPLDKKLLGKAAAKEPAAEEGKPARETYGPVKKGENLSGIAVATKPDGVSLEQMLVALFQSNKQAFDGDNMNRLKAGQILRMPEAGQAEAVEKSEAVKQVRVHSADWNAYRQKLAAAVAGAKPAQEEAAKQAASGKITTAVEDKGALTKEPAKDVLKLSKSEGLSGAKPAAAAGPAGGKEMQAMKEQIQAMLEEATAKEKAIKDSNLRIAELEKNIKEMQKLLELKNQNLADLQKQAASTKAAPAEPALPPQAAKPEEKPAAPAAQAPKADEKPIAKPKKPRPVLAQPVQPEPSLMDEMLGNPLYLGGGAAGLLLLGLLGARAAAARRKKNVASFEDSIMTSGDLKANTSLGGTSGGKIDTNDTSFLTDFSQAGLGTIDTNEVDPIAEAEVYMAYGRDAQAEEILKEALTKDPSRHEIRLKLLEIYAGRKNLNAFEAVAGEMYAVLGGQASPIWDKAAEMGRALDPDNPLYAEKAKAAAGSDFDKTMVIAGGTAGLISATDHGVTLDLGGPEVAVNAAADLDFDLDIGTPEAEAKPDILLEEAEAEPTSPSQAAEEPVTDLGFDLDLGALAGAGAQAEPAEAPSAAEEVEQAADMGLDFNLETGGGAEASPEVAALEETAEPAAAHEGVLEFDLGELTQAAPEVAEAVEVAETAEADREEGREVGADSAEDLISAESWKDEVMSLESGASGASEDAVLELPDVAMDEETAAAGGEMESIELAAPPVEESPLDFDFNLGLEEGEAPLPEVKEASAPDLDLSGISLEMDDLPSAAAPAGPVVENFGGGQEVSTKLDLAKAYADMGDKEGAREILQEVLKEGSIEQQEEARTLLAEMG